MANVRTWLLIGLLGSLLTIGVFLTAKYWEVFFHDTRVVNELPEYRVSVVNRKELEAYLRNQGFLGNGGLKKIAIVITDHVENPVLVESDVDGNPLVSAKSASKEGLLVIWIGLTENVFDDIEIVRRGRWLSKMFWEMINISQRKITNSVNRDIEPMSIDIFEIRKR